MTNTVEVDVLKIVNDAGLSTQDQFKLFNRFMKRILAHGDPSIVKQGGRKQKSASHKKKTDKAWRERRLAEIHRKSIEETGHLPLKGRRPANKEIF
jgi:hypothetical protein